MAIHRNRLVEFEFNRDLLAEKLRMTRGNLQRIINNERELRVSELLIICEFLKKDPMEVVVPLEASIDTTRAKESNAEASASEAKYTVRLLAEQDDYVTIEWLCDGLHGAAREIDEVKEAVESAQPWLPIIPGRTLMGRAVDEMLEATRRYSLFRDEHEEDRSISRLHLEIYSSPDSPEIIVYLQQPLEFEIEGDRCTRIKGECASLRNGDKIIFPNKAVLEVDSEEL